MLHYIQGQIRYEKKLLRKPVNILVTNECNLRCRGCSQLICHFDKSERWFISLDQLNSNIKHIIKFKKNMLIGIFGGEPIVHPKWKQIHKIISVLPSRFLVYSNGVKKIETYGKNLLFRISKKNSNTKFRSTLNALIDNLGFSNRLQLVQYAFSRCLMWNRCRCIIYDNRAYFCEVAAAFDRFHIGQKDWCEKSSGWEINNDKYVFDRTYEEVIEQAMKFCWQCGWSLKKTLIKDTLISITNQKFFNK